MSQFYETMRLFHDKHFKDQTFFLVNWLIYAARWLCWEAGPCCATACARPSSAGWPRPCRSSGEEVGT